MNRLRHQLIAGAAAAAVLALVGCGSEKPAKSPTGGAGAVTEASGATGSSGEFEKTLESALKRSRRFESGRVEIEGRVEIWNNPSADAPESEVTYSGKGIFERSGRKIVKLDMEVVFGVGGGEQKTRFIRVDGKSYIIVGEEVVEIDANTRGSFSGALDGIGPDSLSNLSRTLAPSVANVQKKGTTDVDGVTVVTYTAEIDYLAALKTLSGKGKSSVFSGIIDRFPPGTQLAFKPLSAEFGVDESDGAVRVAKLGAEVSDSSGKSPGRIKFEFSMKLFETDGPLKVKKPKGAVKGEESVLGTGE